LAGIASAGISTGGVIISAIGGVALGNAADYIDGYVLNLGLNLLSGRELGDHYQGNDGTLTALSAAFMAAQTFGHAPQVERGVTLANLGTDAELAELDRDTSQRRFARWLLANEVPYYIDSVYNYLGEVIWDGGVLLHHVKNGSLLRGAFDLTFNFLSTEDRESSG
jgi:hypothetical protein